MQHILSLLSSLAIVVVVHPCTPLSFPSHGFEPLRNDRKIEKNVQRMKLN